MSTSTAALTPPRHIDTYDAGLAAALRALDGIVASAEPAVVFTSVVRLCVPLICAPATVTIRESDKEGCSIAWPRDTAHVNVHLRRSTVATSASGAETEQHAGYYGAIDLPNGVTVRALDLPTTAPGVGNRQITDLLSNDTS